MELKPGYKQTEVGVIPADWEATTVGREFTVQLGKMLDSEKNIGSPKPYLGNRAVQWGRIELRELATMRMSDADLAKYRLKDGDLLVCEGGEVGRSAIWNSPIDECYYQKALHRLRPIGVYNSNYMLAVLEHWANHGVLNNFVTQTSIAHLPKEKFVDVPIPLPPLPEQSAIASALGDVDTLLAAQDALIAKHRAIKQGAMRELLTGKRRLPGFGGEWEVRRLDQLAEIHSGGTPSTTRPEFWDGDVLWVTPTDITALGGRKYLADTARKITALGLKASSAEIIPTNSIVMTTRATIGECAITAVPLSTNQGFKNFVPYESVDVEFLYYLLTTQKQGFISLCAGSTFLEIGKAQLIGYQVRIPKKDEQIAISQALAEIDAEINALESKREKIARLKQGMMQELLTGRIRLVQPAAMVAATPAEGKSGGGRKANVYFMRSVLAAEIIDQLHNEPTFGHVKFEKMIFLSEHLCKVDTGSHYHRDAAGPYDNRALRSIDSQLKTQKWFEAQKLGGRYQYVPLEKHGGHKQYFDRYYANIRPRLDEIIATFRTAKTEQCEIISTLYSAWNDLLKQGKPVTDDAIVDQVLNHWHEDKKRIEPGRWHKALDWMREKAFVPEGSGLTC